MARSVLQSGQKNAFVGFLYLYVLFTNGFNIGSPAYIVLQKCLRFLGGLFFLIIFSLKNGGPGFPRILVVDSSVRSALAQYEGVF